MTDELTQLIYIQLLELHTIDMEIENMGLYLQVQALQLTKNMPHLPPPIPPNPWHQPPYIPNPPIYYGPPYVIT